MKTGAVRPREVQFFLLLMQIFLLTWSPPRPLAIYQAIGAQLGDYRNFVRGRAG